MGDAQSTYGCSPRQRSTSITLPVQHTSNCRISNSGRHGLSWRFWRTLSFRRIDKFRSRYKSRDERLSDVTDYWRHENSRLRGDLPDVLEDAACLKDEVSPQKQKRRSLFRSMSLILSKNSSPDDTHQKHRSFSSRDDFQSQSPVKSTASKEVIPRELSNDSIKLVKNSFTMFSADFYLPHNEDSNITSGEKIKEVPLKKCLPSNIRASSPVNLSPASMDSGQKRTLSLDRTVDRDTSHKLVLSHVQDLLCLRLNPKSLMFDLHAVGLVSSDDYLSSDSEITLEQFLTGLWFDNAGKFDVFIEVLKNIDGYEDLSVILDAMKSICDMIYKLNSDTSTHATDSRVMDEDTKLSFDVGFLDSQNGRLMPIVKLKETKERKDTKSKKNLFRLSVHSLTSDLDIEDYAAKQKYKIPMISVYLSGHNLRGDRCKALAQTIERYHCILELNIGKSQIGDEDFDKICMALRSNRCISSLDVRLNDIGDEGAAKLGAVMRRSCNLRLLNMSSTGIRAPGCKSLCHGLQINARLRDLDLSFVDVGDEGCVHLSDMITKNCSLTRLRLRSNNIGWAGCALIFESLTRNQTLEELDLSRNAIGNKGVEAMCLHLPNVVSIVDLNLENCSITIDGCENLGSALRHSTALKRLDLSVNYVGDTGVDNLRSVITNAKSIECLGLNMCGITNAGFMSVLDALETNKSINLLKLCYNRIGRDRRIDADDIRFRLHCVKSSKPKLKLLLWGNVLDDKRANNRDDASTASSGDADNGVKVP